MRISRLSRFGIAAVLAAVIAGCSSGPSIVGTWVAKVGKNTSTLVAKPDGSISVKSTDGNYDGTWHTEGNEVIMYRDLRQGGVDGSFGGSWNGAFRYRLNKAGNEMVSIPPPNGSSATSVTLHKVG